MWFSLYAILRIPIKVQMSLVSQMFSSNKQRSTADFWSTLEAPRITVVRIRGQAPTSPRFYIPPIPMCENIGISNSDERLVASATFSFVCFLPLLGVEKNGHGFSQRAHSSTRMKSSELSKGHI